MSKIILFQPMAYSKYTGMPMGLLLTASNLTSYHDVVAVDLVATPLTDKEIISFIVNENPDFVLIGGTSISQPESYHIASLIKTNFPKIIVIKGGPHELFYPEQTAKHPEIDFVLSGDGETIPLLIEAILDGKQTEKIFYGTIHDLSNTALPDRLLLYNSNSDYYDFLGVSTAQIRMTRGCVFNCSYCSQGTFRSYSNDYILTDLENISQNGFLGVYWDDAIFTLDRKRLESLLPQVSEYKFTMGCITRAGVNTDKETLQLMKKSGFEYIWFALESGDKKIRKQFNRENTGIEEVRQAVANARKVGLQPMVNIIIGSALENENTIQITIDALKYIKPYGVSVSVFTIYPGHEGCDALTYENPINRDRRLMPFDEGYGGKILIEPATAEKWYHKIEDSLDSVGIKVLNFSDCRTPRMWQIPTA